LDLPPSSPPTWTATGDVDILSAYCSDEIAWHENVDGKGRFGEKQVLTNAADGARSVYAADVDGDRDVDVLSASWYDKLACYENLSPPPFAAGDANGDLQFDHDDIAQVLQAAKYLTRQDATFGEADWTDDGVFDQLDINGIGRVVKIFW